MPNTQEFRRRIKSINNTKQITAAMEMVASVKMQKAHKNIMAGRTYVQDTWNMLVKLAQMTLPEEHPLLQPHDVEKIAVILVASDRGLCGAFNADVFRKFLKFRKENQSECDVIAIGKKSAEFIKISKSANLIAEFTGFENNVLYEDIIPISLMSNGEYLKGNYSKVMLIYSHFESSLRQIPVVKQILPIQSDHIDNSEVWQKTTEEEIEYKFEPSPDIVLESLLPRFIRMQIYGAILESNASEHSARMMAMKNATDNAGDLINDLTLLYNTIRQNSITSEIAEISAAAEAMK